MRILAFNAGSASLKFDLIEIAGGQAPASHGKKLVSATVEGIGSAKPTLSEMDGKNVAKKEDVRAGSYTDAAGRAYEYLSGRGEVDRIAHRVVHGANRFQAPVPIDDRVLSVIEELDALAPLHNQPATEVIRAARLHSPGKTQVAVFDSAFHRTLPATAYTYALPAELNERHGIRRYGFHGISHSYLFTRYLELSGRKREDARVITLHLEGGSSACAIRGGKSVETSMGFTPLEGLVMGKRSGDIDPAIVGFLARAENWSLERVEHLLNHQSGLLGLSGVSHDTRDLMKEFENSASARLAMEVFCHHVRKYIGAYLAVLGGADAIIFGGGIGEDTPWVREQVCSDMEWFGLHLDPIVNANLINQEGRISADESRLEAWVILTEEALAIAAEAAQVDV